MSVKILLTRDLESAKQIMNTENVVATVEAEYGDYCIEAEQTLAHHGNRSNNPAPCNWPNVKPINDGVILVSHLDLDTIGGIWALLGTKIENPDFWQGAEFIDLNGPHNTYQLPEDIQKLINAYEGREFVRQNSQEKVIDVTNAVQNCINELTKILDKNHPEHEETMRKNLESYDKLQAEIESKLLRENEQMRVFVTDGVFCGANYYSKNLNKVCPMTLSLNTNYNFLTLAFENNGSAEDKNFNARDIMKALYGPEAGGHNGIAGTPRGELMTIKDLELLEDVMSWPHINHDKEHTFAKSFESIISPTDNQVDKKKITLFMTDSTRLDYINQLAETKKVRETDKIKIYVTDGIYCANKITLKDGKMAKATISINTKTNKMSFAFDNSVVNKAEIVSAIAGQKLEDVQKAMEQDSNIINVSIDEKKKEVFLSQLDLLEQRITFALKRDQIKESIYGKIVIQALCEKERMSTAEAELFVTNKSYEEIEKKMNKTESILNSFKGLLKACDIYKDKDIEKARELIKKMDNSLDDFVKEKLQFVEINPEKIMDALTIIHDNWVESLSAALEFNTKDNEYQYLPIEFIGWDEAKRDLMFLNPFIENINSASELREEDIKKEFVKREVAATQELMMSGLPKIIRNYDALDKHPQIKEKMTQDYKMLNRTNEQIMERVSTFNSQGFDDRMETVLKSMQPAIDLQSKMIEDIIEDLLLDKDADLTLNAIAIVGKRSFPESRESSHVAMAKREDNIEGMLLKRLEQEEFVSQKQVSNYARALMDCNLFVTGSPNEYQVQSNLLTAIINGEDFKKVNDISKEMLSNQKIDITQVD